MRANNSDLKKENEELKSVVSCLTRENGNLNRDKEVVSSTLLELENYTKERKEYFHKVIENQLEEKKELKKENEALHKGWKLPEIEKIRKYNEELYKK